MLSTMRNLTALKSWTPALAALMLLALSACSKVTPERYAQLEAGMSRAEVHALLGAPDDVSGSGIGRFTMTTETWEGRTHVVRATFAGDTLTLKSIEPRQPR